MPLDAHISAIMITWELFEEYKIGNYSNLLLKFFKKKQGMTGKGYKFTPW